MRKQPKKKYIRKKSTNTKMVSFRFTNKMLAEIQYASYNLGVPLTKIVALGIETIYQQALKNEKKE